MTTISQIDSTSHNRELTKKIFGRIDTAENQKSLTFDRSLLQTVEKKQKNQELFWRQNSQLQVCFNLQQWLQATIWSKISRIYAIASKKLPTYSTKDEIEENIRQEL